MTNHLAHDSFYDPKCSECRADLAHARIERARIRLLYLRGREIPADIQNILTMPAKELGNPAVRL